MAERRALVERGACCRPRTPGCDTHLEQVDCAYPSYVLRKVISTRFANSGSPAVGVIRRFSWTAQDQDTVGEADHRAEAEAGRRRQEVDRRQSFQGPGLARLTEPPFRRGRRRGTVGAVNERVDAARNRARVLDAAARLFAAEGVDAVSMEEVAREAGVGKATLYRRYADKGELSAALIDADARALQAEVLAGVPSAGECATARERVERLLLLFAGFVERHSVADGRRAPSPRQSRDAGLRVDAGLAARVAARGRARRRAAADADVEYLADALLAPLTPDIWRHQRHVRGMESERLAAGAALARAVARARRLTAGGPRSPLVSWIPWQHAQPARPSGPPSTASCRTSRAARSSSCAASSA